MAYEMAMESKSGQMAHATQASGEKVWRTDKVSLNTQTEISTKAPGSMIKLTAKETINMQMELGMSVNGWKTCNMVRV